MGKRPGTPKQPNQAGALAGEKQSDIAFCIEFISIYRKTDILAAVVDAENTNKYNHMCPAAGGPFILPSFSSLPVIRYSTTIGHEPHSATMGPEAGS